MKRANFVAQSAMTANLMATELTLYNMTIGKVKSRTAEKLVSRRVTTTTRADVMYIRC